MKIKIDPMTEDLRRQRRNLIMISFILCFMKYGGVVIAKTTLLGTEINFTNILAIFLALWLIWLYFCIRYYQYFMQEGLPKIRFSINDMLTEKCRIKIKSIVISKHPNIEEGSSQMFDYNILKKTNWFTILFIGREPIKNDAFGKKQEFNMEINIWELWKEFLKSYCQVFFNQSVITDYIFPILFGVFTFIYCNFGNWDGRVLNLIR